MTWNRDSNSFLIELEKSALQFLGFIICTYFHGENLAFLTQPPLIYQTVNLEITKISHETQMNKES